MSKFKPPSVDIESLKNYVSEQTPPNTDRMEKTDKGHDTKEEKTTSLYNGEKVSKNDKILSALGTLEELLAYIGILKCQYFSGEDSELELNISEKLFISARLTQIQESLIDIMSSVGTSKKINARYENTRFSNTELIKDLEREIEKYGIDYKVKDKPLQIIPGTNKLEAELLYCRSITRRAERQVYGVKNTNLGIIPEKTCIDYLNKLGDYFLSLALYILGLGLREPIKKIHKYKRQPNLK